MFSNANNQNSNNTILKKLNSTRHPAQTLYRRKQEQQLIEQATSHKNDKIRELIDNPNQELFFNEVTKIDDQNEQRLLLKEAIKINDASTTLVKTVITQYNLNAEACTTLSTFIEDKIICAKSTLHEETNESKNKTIAILTSKYKLSIINNELSITSDETTNPQTILKTKLISRKKK